MSDDPRDLVRKAVTAVIRSAVADHAPTEDRLVRAALRAKDVQPGLLAHRAEVSAASKLTFAMLRTHMHFPAAPTVTGVQVEGPDVLFGRFRHSNLWEAWVAAWDDRPDVHPARRVLVASAVAWGSAVAVYHTPAPPDRPHALVGFGVAQTPLVVERFKTWVENLAWDPDVR